jgi:hypothetical protein
MKIMVLMVALTLTQAQAAMWVEFGDPSPVNPASSQEIDSESLVAKYGLMKAWVRTSSILPMVIPENGKTAKSSLFIEWIDCAKSMWLTTEHYYFSEIKSGGQVVAMTNPLYGQEAIVNGMLPIVSGTIDAQLQKFMCSQKTAR